MINILQIYLYHTKPDNYMGTDAKLMALGSDKKFYVDRKYNIKNGLLEAFGYDEYIETFGIPNFMFYKFIYSMCDLSEVVRADYVLYSKILFWLKTLPDHEYIILIDEHRDEY